MTETSELVTGCEFLEALGQVWTFSHVGPAIRGAYSAWLKAKARQGLQDEKRTGILDEATFREESNALKEQFDAGAYNWGSPLDPEGVGKAVAQSLQQTEGNIRFIQLLLEKAHGQVEARKVHEMVKANRTGVHDTIAACMGVSGNSTAPATKTADAGATA